MEKNMHKTVTITSGPGWAIEVNTADKQPPITRKQKRIDFFEKISIETIISLIGFICASISFALAYFK